MDLKIMAKDLLHYLASFGNSDYISADDGAGGETKKINSESIRAGLAEATTLAKGLMSAADKTNVDANTTVAHTHNTDTIIDEGGANEVTAAVVKTVTDHFDAADSYKLKPTGLQAQTKTLSAITDVPDYIGQLGILGGNYLFAYGASAGNWIHLNSKSWMWTRGNVTINRTARTMSVDDIAWLITNDGRAFVLQGGSGSGVITDFAYSAAGSVNIIYVDALVAAGSQTLTLITESYNAVTQVATGYERFIVGTAYVGQGVFINGLTEQELLKRTINLEIKGYIWNRGTVTVSYVSGLISVDNLCYYVTGDGRSFVLQGGTGSGLITDFEYNNGSAVNIVYIDIPTSGGSGTSIALQKATVSSIPSIAASYNRIILGTSYKNSATDYFLHFQGLTEKDNYRILKPLWKNNPIGKLWSQGDTTIDYTNHKLTNSSLVWFTHIDGRSFVMEGGSGSGVITDYDFYTTGDTGIYLIYIDIPITGGAGSTVALQKARWTAMPTIAVDYQRVLLGTSGDVSGGVYSLWIENLSEKDLHRRLETAETTIVTNAAIVTTNKTILINAIDGNLLTGNNFNMSGANNWVSGYGSPTMDINSTVAGKMYISFDGLGTSKQVKYSSLLDLSGNYKVRLKIRLLSGTAHYVRFGKFSSSSGASQYWYDVFPTSDEKTWAFTLYNIDTADFTICCIDTQNTSAFTISIDDVEVTRFISEQPKKIAWQCEEFLQSLSRNDKTLTKLIVTGDSLMANDGDAVYSADDEGVTMRPPRLAYNNFPRRLYDYLKFNPASYRRIDHIGWTLGGTWTDTHGVEFLESPDNNAETYKWSQTANAYAEFAIPSGFENFAIILHKDDNEHGQDYDDVITVTINGGDISSYGSSSINSYRTKLVSYDVGNPWYTELYEGLPGGINTIRITKSNNVKTLMLWGIAYWTGNTFMVINAAHGGHTLTDLLRDHKHLNSEVLENNPDAVLFEIPLMNQTGKSQTIDNTMLDLNAIVTLFNGKDLGFMSCNIMADNGAGTNYYTLYPNPNMQQHAEIASKTIWDNRLPYVDVFEIFRRKVINKGGTLEGYHIGF